MTYKDDPRAERVKVWSDSVNMFVVKKQHAREGLKLIIIDIFWITSHHLQVYPGKYEPFTHFWINAGSAVL